LSRAVTLADLYLVIEEKLRAGGRVSLMASGVSMLPMLKHQRDTVVLGPATGTLLVNDVVLYRREGGQFVLHRVVGLESNGNYILCGDNQFVLEHHINHKQVVGRLVGFIRNGRRISCTSPWYKAYVLLLPVLRFLKHGLFIGLRYAANLMRRICRLTNGNG